MGEVQVHDADASSEPGCSRDQKQPCSDDDGPDGSRDALTGRCEAFDGDRCPHDSHRAKVHDPDCVEDPHQAGSSADLCGELWHGTWDGDEKGEDRTPAQVTLRDKQRLREARPLHE